MSFPLRLALGLVPYRDRLTLHHADIRDILPQLASNSIDLAIVDPPYAIGQDRKPGGRRWDADEIAFDANFWREVRRVLRPGATLFCFGASRTSHKSATAIETAGFQIFDQLFFAKGNSYPAGDRELSAELERIGSIESAGDYVGWHTHFRNSVEPIIIARNLKPGQSLPDAIASGGIGGLNIDAARIPSQNDDRSRKPGTDRKGHALRIQRRGNAKSIPHPLGRHPSNLVLLHEEGCSSDACIDSCPATAIDENGRRKCRAGRERASRLFSRLYYSSRATPGGHPTAKPDPLCEWIAALTVREGMNVLDPFGGGGSISIAIARRGGNVICVEHEADYVALIESRFAEADRE